MGMLLACVSAYNHKQTDLSSHGYQVTFDYFSDVCMYVCMYVRTYVRTYVHTYIHTYIHTSEK